MHRGKDYALLSPGSCDCTRMSLASHKNTLGARATNSAISKMAGREKANSYLPVRASILFPGKCDQKKDRQMLKKFLKSQEKLGFSVMMPIEQLRAVGNAINVIGEFELISSHGHDPSFNQKCRDTIILLDNLKTEITRRAVSDAAKHKKYYNESA